MVEHTTETTLLTPEDLARELGTTGRRVRGFLRMRFPRPPTDLGSRWDLAEEQVAEVRRRFSVGSYEPLARPAASATRAQRTGSGTKTASQYHEEWYWEGKVQAAMRGHLESQGWKIESEANTATKEPGDDIRATRDGQTMVVEVKGYPSDGYADPGRSGEVKPTSPTTQARHWFAQALLRSVRTVASRPDAVVAMAFPAKATYRRLLTESSSALQRLGIIVFLVDGDGSTVRLDEAGDR
jgi:hypothetical protein